MLKWKYGWLFMNDDCDRVFFFHYEVCVEMSDSVRWCHCFSRIILLLFLKIPVSFSFFLSFFLSILILSFLPHTLKLCQLFLLLSALFIIVLFCAFAYPLALCILNANVNVCASVCRPFAYGRCSYFSLNAVVERLFESIGCLISLWAFWVLYSWKQSTCFAGLYVLYGLLPSGFRVH